MPTAQTAQFGAVPYTEADVIVFQAGLPAFECERSFVLLQPPESEPLLFLQSLSNPQLAFLAIAVQNVAANFRADLSDEDTSLLGSPPPDAGFDVLALVAISPGGEVSANLQAPIVIHRSSRLAVQAIQTNPAYSCRHPLGAPPPSPPEEPCS